MSLQIVKLQLYLKIPIWDLIQNKFFVLASGRIESEILKVVNDKEILNKIYVSSSYLDEDMLRKARELI